MHHDAEQREILFARATLTFAVDRNSRSSSASNAEQERGSPLHIRRALLSGYVLDDNVIES
jgi:hypothetical protein